jgi:hypothetical protein
MTKRTKDMTQYKKMLSFLVIIVIGSIFFRFGRTYKVCRTTSTISLLLLLFNAIISLGFIYATSILVNWSFPKYSLLYPKYEV